MPFELRTQVDARNHALDGVRIPTERGNFEGEGLVHCKVYGHSAVSCSKTAETTEMPFGLWARIDSTNHVLDLVQIHHWKGQFWGEKRRPIVNYREVCCELCRNGWTDRDAVWDLVVGPKEACIRWSAHWCHLANTTDPSMYDGCGLLSNYFGHLLLFGRLAVGLLRK